MKKILISILILFSTSGIAQELPDGAVTRFSIDFVSPLTERVDAIFSVAFSKDGKTLASGSELGFVRIWDLEKKRLKRTLSGFGFGARVAYSPDGKTLVTVTESRNGEIKPAIKLWDSDTLFPKHELELADEDFQYTPVGYVSVEFSPDGKTIAAGVGVKLINGIGTGHSAVWGWDIETGDFKFSAGWEKFGSAPNRSDRHRIGFSPDGNHLIAGSKIYDAHSGRWQRTLRGVTIRALAFSPNEETIAFVISDVGHLLQLWNFRRGLKEVDLIERKFVEMSPGFLDLEYSPDGKTLAGAGNDGTIRFYDIETREERQILEGHMGSVYSINYSPDGNLLASGSFDGSILIWDSINEFNKEEEIPEIHYRIEDINLDGIVDISDLTLVAKQFGRKFGQWGENRADVNGDLVVDIVDLQLVAEAFDNVPAAPSMVTFPSNSKLLPNYPNPFNPETWIPYYLANDTNVVISIYNTKGDLVRDFDLDYRRSGLHKEHWDGRNEGGESVASGTYIYHFLTDNYSETRKMVISR